MDYFRLVLLSRGVYSLMWFYTAPILPVMIKEFHVDPAHSGLLPAFFILGAAFMQIPASYFGAKYSHDRVAGIGMVIFGLSSILMATARGWTEALVYRALGGVGAGLFFSTAGAVLVATRPREVGSALGWYNSSFNIGAFTGFYWGYVNNAVGWRLALAIPGVFAVALGLLLSKRALFKSRAVFEWKSAAYGIASFPFWGAVYAANSLTATWLHLYRGVAEELAGAISSAAMISGFFGGFTGRLFDRAKRKRLLLVASPLAGAVSYVAISVLPAYVVALAVFAYGISFSMYITSIYAVASKNAENPASALAMINVTNMALGLNVSYIFTSTMAISPYLPWWILSSLCLISASVTYIVVNRIKTY